MQQYRLKRNRFLAAFVLLVLSGSGAEAGGESVPEPAVTEPALKPFKAYYQAKFDLGINISGEAVRELRDLGEGQWLLSMKAKAMLAKIDESSRFEVQPQLRPLQYDYQRSIFGKKKRLQQHFDWSNGTLTYKINDQSTQLNLDPQTQDKISYQIQLWLDLKAGLEQMHYTLADGNQLNELNFNRAGEETLDTPAGRFETIKVTRDRGAASTRQTHIWFAKKHDHLIVKLEQIETDGKQYILLLERVESR